MDNFELTSHDRRCGGHPPGGVGFHGKSAVVFAFDTRWAVALPRMSSAIHLRASLLFKKRIRKLAGPLLALALFALAIRLLWGEIQGITWEEFVLGLTGVPPLQIGMAAFLITLNYVLLIAYDILALRYVARSLPIRRVALVSISGFSLGNNLGTLLAGAPIRFRFYSQWGLSPGQIVAIISICGLTFWSGLWFLGGMVLIWVPIDLPPKVQLPFGTQTLGVDRKSVV